MRVLLVAFLVATSACAARQTTWTPVAVQQLEDGHQAFVLLGVHALHLSHVELVDGRLHARIVRAWQLPPVGAAAIADDAGTSPEDLARRAGWPELRIASARLDAPLDAIRSARMLVDVAPDDDDRWNDSDRSILVAVVTSLLEVALVQAR